MHENLKLFLIQDHQLFLLWDKIVKMKIVLIKKNTFKLKIIKLFKKIQNLNMFLVQYKVKLEKMIYILEIYF